MHDLDFGNQREQEEETADEVFQTEIEPEALWGEVLDESEVDELASALLEVTNDQELDHFIGRKLFGSLRKKLGGLGRSALTQQLGGALKGLIQKGLPVAAGMLGSAFGGPAGAAIARSASGMLGKFLGLELEGLSQEDKEFETAKQLVRFSADATRRAVQSPTGASATRVVSNAMQQTAQQYAPGLATKEARPREMQGRSGRWYYRNGRIYLQGFWS